MTGHDACTILTPSFRREVPLFQALHETVARFAPAGFRHVVIVPGRDTALFAPFAGPRTEIVAIEDLVPGGFVRLPDMLNPLPSRREIWLSARTRPVRGWIMQQLVKIAAAAAADTDAVLFADSDTVLIRPLTPEALCKDGRLRLFVERGAAAGLETHRRWAATAGQVLGLGPAVCDDNYIGDFITWRAPVARAMIRRLEEVNGRPWWRVLAAVPAFSEYVLYGRFAEEAGADSGQVPDDAILFRSSWDVDLHAEGGAGAFVDGIEPFHIGATVQSRAAVPLAERRRIIAMAIDRTAAGAAS